MFGKTFAALKHAIYSLYAEIASRLTVDRDHRPLPSVPCQYCGGNHKEDFCPRAKEMGFLDDDE